MKQTSIVSADKQTKWVISKPTAPVQYLLV